MRIIAGELRGRQIVAPEGTVTRPITDRVKQSLFDILSPLIDGARVYDCFAGTGSMGLECLSRGASHVTFFENDRSAVARLRKNIESLGLADRSTIVSRDIFRLDRAGANNVDLAFLDPPYHFLRDRVAELTELAGSLAVSQLSSEGIVIFRHDSRDRLELPPLERYDQRDYGGMTIELLRKSSK